MLQHILGNDPRPDYFHQTNMMGSPPAGDPTTGTPPATSPSVGDGLYYSTMNQLLKQYSSYYNVPVQQLTSAQISALLAQQAAWASNTQVSGYIQGNQVTITNGGAATQIPLTGIASVGSTYGGTQSGWTSAAAGSTTYTAQSTWPAPGVAQAPQGGWVGQLGTSGYLLAGWDGTQDVSNLPGVTPTLVSGTRTQWAANTADVRALQAPDGSVVRNASAYSDPNVVTEGLKFTNAYTGDISIYAVDWDNLGRTETISVNDGSGPRLYSLAGFSQGKWLTFPVSVAAGATVTISATNTATAAGATAVISAVMIGDAGAPPVTNGTQAPQGNWSKTYGAAGYDLAGWNGTSDLSWMPDASVTLDQGTRELRTATTTDVRALTDPTGTSRTAADYTDPNQVRVKLTFNQAYTGNLHLYSVDWDTTARRELITVNGQTSELSSDFSQGGWVSFPITEAAGNTLLITVDRTAGTSAVLSGIFLGEAPGQAPTAQISTPADNQTYTQNQKVPDTVQLHRPRSRDQLMRRQQRRKRYQRSADRDAGYVDDGGSQVHRHRHQQGRAGQHRHDQLHGRGADHHTSGHAAGDAADDQPAPAGGHATRHGAGAPAPLGPVTTGLHRPDRDGSRRSERQAGRAARCKDGADWSGSPGQGNRHRQPGSRLALLSSTGNGGGHHAGAGEGATDDPEGDHPAMLQAAGHHDHAPRWRSGDDPGQAA